MKCPIVRLTVVSLLALCMVGCSGGPAGPKTVPVSGTVTLDGSPLAGATVTFSPVSGGKAAAGTTDQAGKFELITPGGGAGAVPGSYKVTVTKVEGSEAADAPEDAAPIDEGEQVEVRLLVPEKYTKVDTTDLTVEVKEGMGPVNLALSSQ